MKNTTWYQIPAPLWSAVPQDEWDQELGNAVIFNSANAKFLCLIEDEGGAFVRANGGVSSTSLEASQDCGIGLDASAIVSAQFFEAGPTKGGLGDRVSGFMRWLGFHGTCSGCDTRRRFLNRLSPYRR